ncbi:HupE/UreJ family protein [Shewanella corallii]|uniref:HupE/UreJ family protein n=1 Tax=Shewanella corallii TaxID=560080 RepID=A0ABT0N7Q5_9GAMM|nr:HupE/UreJ family protein [Shewanella corallii]MCL2914180.1 HupE/UreJ family protein [Shewanella corallii]
MLNVRNSLVSLIIVFCVLLMAGLEQTMVSPEVSQGVQAGLLHHLSGVAHLLVMLGIGIWAVMLGHKAWLWLPLGVLSALVIGSLLGRSAMAHTLCQAGMVLSVLMLGALIAGNVRWPVLISLSLVSVLSLFHGYGHGFEYTNPHGFIAYIGGITLASALSIAAGVTLANVLDITHKQRNRELLGMATLLCGAALVWLA